MVTHYDCSPKHFRSMQYYKPNKIGKCKIKPEDVQILPALVSIFSQILPRQVCAYAIQTKLSYQESFCQKVSIKRGSS